MTQQDKSRAIDAPRLRGPRGNTATAVSHVEAQTWQISLWPLRPSQAVRRKHRWSLANWQNLTVGGFFSLCFVFYPSCSTVEEKEDSIFLYFGYICRQALVEPFTGGKYVRLWACVCVCVSGLLWALTSSWWVHLTLLRNMEDVSLAISEVKCSNMSRDRGRVSVLFIWAPC